MAHTEVTDKTRNRSNTLLGVGLAIILACAAFFSGLELGSGVSEDRSLEAGLFSFFWKQEVPAEEADLGEFWRVWHLLEDKYVSATSTGEVSATDRVEGAIDGLVDSYGDPYTVFLPREDAEQFEEDISGNFGGVGMEVGLRDGLVTVIAPLPDTPAEQAGILAGDVVVRIDETDTSGMNIDEAVKLIRGEPGTEVQLRMYREGEVDFLDITVVRDVINIPTLKTK
ncbi:MAG: PDZ domain-containing protein, partial [Candidatus Paceibacterota bacterium]